MRLLAFVLVCCAGCSGGPTLARVTGTVTFAGKPVTAGTILFTPAQGPTAVGEIQPDGTYTLTTLRPGDGAVVGAHKVTILATAVGPNSMAFATPEAEIAGSGKQGKGQPVLVPGKVTWLVPQKYSELATTTLTADVAPGENVCNIDVKAAP